MVIAVNTRFLLADHLEGCGYFVQEVFRRLVLKYPQHQFYFLFDRPFDPSFIFAPNAQGIVIGPPARHPLLWKYWYDVRVPAVLRRIRADVFVSPDGYCSLTTSVPQCLVVHDLGFLHHPEAYKRSHVPFLKFFVPRFLKKAKTVATVSQFSKNDILKHYATDPQKISIVYSAPKPVFRPLDRAIVQSVRDKYAGGAAYFVYVGALQPRKNLVNLLKAFSQFKKRQQTSMKLVLAGRMAWKNDAFSELLRTYKYREDVVLTGYIGEKELVELVGGAYALVYPSLFEGFGVPVLEAMQAGVPALTSRSTSMEEIGGSAALYFDPKDPADIAAALMRIYKDDRLKQQMIEDGFAVAANFTWERTAGLLWDCILRAAQQ